MRAPVATVPSNETDAVGISDMIRQLYREGKYPDKTMIEQGGLFHAHLLFRLWRLLALSLVFSQQTHRIAPLAASIVP
jgi:hypothetical protein